MNNRDRERVLLLEDDDFDAAVTRELLEKCCRRPFSTERVSTLKGAVAKLSRDDYLAALVDMNVPDSAGLDTVRDVIQANLNIPVIVLSCNDDTELGIEALSLGAQDFLPKSALDSRSLERTIAYAARRKTKEKDLHAKAYYDALTGAANRALLHDRFERGLARARRAGRKLGILVVDVDNFKSVNDAFGHDAGDRVLIAIAENLQKSVRSTDIVARLGGDEFVVVLENVRDKSEVNAVRDKIMAQRGRTNLADGKSIAYSMSIGGATCEPTERCDLLESLRRADQEMYGFKARTHERAA